MKGTFELSGRYAGTLGSVYVARSRQNASYAWYEAERGTRHQCSPLTYTYSYSVRLLRVIIYQRYEKLGGVRVMGYLARRMKSRGRPQMQVLSAGMTG